MGDAKLCRQRGRCGRWNYSGRGGVAVAADALIAERVMYYVLTDDGGWASECQSVPAVSVRACVQLATEPTRHTNSTHGYRQLATQGLLLLAIIFIQCPVCIYG